MMRATRGRSSRACQVMAVVLTYGAITTSYLPAMISGAVKAQKKKKTDTAAQTVLAPKPAKLSPAAAVAGLGAAIVILIGISLALPFMMLAHSPVAGLINLVILFIGLSKAWRLTTPFRAPILGPYTGASS
jgi:hypothetical protein